MNRTIIRALAVATVGILALSGCSPEPETQSQGDTSSVTQVTGDEDSVFVETDDEEVSDCDREDRAKNETPDCGFRYQGQFYTWGWVRAGRTTPPYGWSASREHAQTVATLRAAARPSKAAVTPGAPAPRATATRATAKSSSKARTPTRRR